MNPLLPAGLRILLVEDEEAHKDALCRMLEGTRSRIQVRVAPSLETAEAMLDEVDFDVLILDLNLPDSRGIETLLRTMAKAPNIPVIVLTGHADEELGLEAIRKGAQDYLVKGNGNRTLLIRSIRDSVERMARERAQIQELQLLRDMSRAQAAPSTAAAFGVVPLSEQSPKLFQELCDEYGRLLEHRLEQQAFRVEQNVFELVKRFADRIGFLHGGPRDLIEVHCSALNRRTQSEPEARSQAYVDEGRLLVLQVMGCLASFYRDHCASGRVPATPTKQGQE